MKGLFEAKQDWNNQKLLLRPGPLLFSMKSELREPLCDDAREAIWLAYRWVSL